MAASVHGVSDQTLSERIGFMARSETGTEEILLDFRFQFQLVVLLLGGLCLCVLGRVRNRRAAGRHAAHTAQADDTECQSGGVVLLQTPWAQARLLQLVSKSLRHPTSAFPATQFFNTASC